MNPERQVEINERRAAVLLGLTIVELRRLSQTYGLGKMEKTGCGKEMVLTYEELRRLSILAARSMD